MRASVKNTPSNKPKNKTTAKAAPKPKGGLPSTYP